MALEIPSLRSDRLPGPDWGNVPTMERLSLSASRLLAVLQGVPAAASVLDDLRTLSAAGASVDVFVAPDHASVLLQLDGRRVGLPGAARDAVLTLLTDPADAARAASAAAPRPTGLAADPALSARVAVIEAQIQESRAAVAGGAGGAAAPAAPAAIAVRLPLLAGAGAEQAALAVSRAVAASGLFLEAHVAQWLRGERTLAQILDEVRLLASGSAEEAPARTPDWRATGQLDALQTQSVHLTALAWAGQPLRLDIERDVERHPEAANAGDATGLFQATLSLQLPRLGALRARVRCMEGTVGVQIETGAATSLASALPQLDAALAARGLHVAALTLAPAQESADGR